MHCVKIQLVREHARVKQALKEMVLVVLIKTSAVMAKMADVMPTLNVLIHLEIENVIALLVIQEMG